MKTVSTKFVVSMSLCFLFMGGITFAAQRGITRDAHGNAYQIDSNQNPWVAVDGKNWNFEISEPEAVVKKVWTREEMKKAGLSIKKTVKKAEVKKVTKILSPKITNSGKGYMYQVDSNENPWVSVDAKNWTLYMTTQKPLTIRDWQVRGLPMYENEKKVIVGFYEEIFNSRKYDNVAARKPKVEIVTNKWDARYIRDNHRQVTKTGDLRTLDFVVEDSKGVVYQIDSNKNFWLTVDTTNWTGAAKDLQETVSERMQRMGSR